ncbi:MAG: type II toxin-antitoxin system RelE/ParE family toxin [Verrucomicrobiota bacterium]|nr:type II toxin-antitoxin system RelE/ParE family toxin [Verrucomicrobiota bacterium]
MIEIDVEIYETSNGRRPFEEWVEDLREWHTQAKIWTRIDRLKMGNFGDCKTLQDGVCELRIHYGPGIRIYYGKIGTKLILLLCGGDKGSQEKNITKAKEYFKDWSERGKTHGKK